MGTFSLRIALILPILFKEDNPDILFSTDCWTYTHQGWAVTFPHPTITNTYGIRRMEELNLIASESMPFIIQEEGIGVGKAGLKVRLASDMDKGFLERLNKFCASTKHPSYSDRSKY